MSRSHVQKCYMDIIYKFCIDAFFSTTLCAKSNDFLKNLLNTYQSPF